MVKYICVLLMLVIAMLAMISRKNYSKYKDDRRPLVRLSYILASRMPVSIRLRLDEYIRRTNTYNTRMLEEKTDEWIAGHIRRILMMLFGLAALVLIISLLPEMEQDTSRVERPKVGSGSITETLELNDTKNHQKEKYQLEIFPREYTEAEFSEKSEKCMDYIEKNILGRNISKDKVSTDLVFPEKDETGTLKIIWETSDPTVINTNGRVENDDIKNDLQVKITATIKDNNYENIYETGVTVVTDSNISDSEKAKLTMRDIEMDGRSEEELIIPEKIGDVEIKKVVETREKKSAEILIIGILLIALWGYYGIFKLRESGDKRNEELQKEYYGFVNRLSIYIGAGLSVQNALRAVIRNRKNGYLYDEITFALNRISSGISEPRAYLELGRSLGSEEYTKLMSLISQNMEYGNSNLMKLMDSEAKMVFYLKKESIRKKGEQASEKLLLPTLILMFIVMIIVMYPAFVGMN